MQAHRMDSKHQYGRLGTAYVNKLRSTPFRLCVGLVPIALAIISAATGAFSYSDNATFTGLEPSTSLKTHAAFARLGAHLPDVLHGETSVAWIRRKDGGAVLGDDAATLSAAIVSAVEGVHDPGHFLIRTQSWFALNSTAPPLAPRLLSTAGDAVVVAVVVDATDPIASGKYLGEVEGTVNGVARGQLGTGFDVTLTGSSLAAEEAQQSAGKGFALADGIGLPVIAVLFWWQIRAVRLLLLPAIAVGVSLILSYGIGNRIALLMDVPSYTPNIALFLCLALAIDYSFFLLSRFQLERSQRGAPLFDAVMASTCMSGRTVCVSGLILAFGWVALVSFPVYGLQGVGVASAVTVVVCIVCNLMLTPAILLQFPKFFSNTLPKAAATATVAEPLLDGAPSAHNTKPNCYARLAAWVTKLPQAILIPVVVLGLMVWGSFQLKDLTTPVGLSYSIGNGPIATAFKHVEDDFATVGLRTPFTIVLGGDALSDAHLTATCALTTALAAMAEVNAPTIQSLAQLPYAASGPAPPCIDAAAAAAYLSGSDASAAAYQYTAGQVLSADNATSVVSFSTTYNPFSGPSEDFSKAVRALLGRVLSQAPSVDNVGLYAPVVVEVDSKALALGRLPWVLAIALVCMFGALGVVYKAAIVPLKLAASIALPVAFVYGMAVRVYEVGVLDDLGWKAVSSAGGISWLLPIATVFLAIGLSTDYELLLFSRVLELRLNGSSNRDAVIGGVGQTAAIISTAGLIMASAFSGMVVNDNRFLNEFGFILISSVLIDTFVVRILVVPALLAVGGWVNWWPRAVPQPRAASIQY